MNILFVSGELIGSAVAQRLVTQGHHVKLYIDHPDRKSCLDGLVEKTENWKSELTWVGKDGLIVFDDVVFRNEQKKLRKQGYSVFGGDAKSDELELNRQLFHEVLKKYGVQVLPSYDFNSTDEAIDFVQNNLDTWVVKHNNHISMLNYVGQKSDGADVLNILQHYKEKNISPIHLQKKVSGVEVGTGRYFNGKDWIGPFEINFEHKPLCNGNIGPLTAEMGTLMWYEEDEDLPIFKETLGKIKDYLIEIDYRGEIGINCIVNEEGIWPLEASMRFGTPAAEVQCELQTTPWGEFLKTLADGKTCPVDYHKGYGIVVSVVVPPFPYGPEVFSQTSDIETSQGVGIFFTEELSEKEKRQLYFEEVSITNDATGKQRLQLAGKHGHALYVTGRGATVEEARSSAYSVVNKLIIPKMFYRTDIGQKFISEDRDKLVTWGLLPDKLY